MYLLLKLLHIASMVAFLGNITTGLFWHAHAARTRDPKLLAFTMDGIIRSDRWFTNPGVIGLVAFGVAMALVGHHPLLRTHWIAGTLVLLTISGVIFATRLIPLQKQMRDFAAEGARTGAFEYSRYHALARQWELWGAVALGAPLLGLVLMVLKPRL